MFAVYTVWGSENGRVGGATNSWLPAVPATKALLLVPNSSGPQTLFLPYKPLQARGG